MSEQSHSLEDCMALVELAGTYAEDGAFRTAADRLERAAKLMRQHAANCDAAERQHDPTHAEIVGIDPALVEGR